MSLFLVNRYLGDQDEDTACSQTRSRALLSKLQQKAKDKRQQQDGGVRGVKRGHEDGDSGVRRVKRGPQDGDGSEKPQKRRKRETDVCEVQPGLAVDKRTGGHSLPGASAEAAAEEDSVPAGFTLLGGFDRKPVQKVLRVLPQWLAEPDLVHRDMKTDLVPVCGFPGLCPRLQEVLQKNGVEHFFPVQAEVIPAVLQEAPHGLLMGRGGCRPRDICVSVPTGSGKTLSFVVPVIQVLKDRVSCEVRALAVLPTKELAQQVYRVFSTYTEGTSLRVAVLSGLKSFAAEQAVLTQHRGCSAADIVVATPGRLVDHINKNSAFCLQHLRFLIIDEADRMIDGMHQAWLDQVLKAVYGPGNRLAAIFSRTEPACVTAASLSVPQVPLQKLLFSATLTQNPEKLQQLGLHQPRLFSSSPQERFHFPQGLTEYYVPCTLSKKPLLILHLLLCLKLRPILCFTNSRETAHRLFLLVQLFGGVRAAEFSSRLLPSERKKALKEFERGTIQLLISTDAAARGIDVSHIKYVVNYDAPQYVRTYIHRVGRTARAGKAGLAFTFLLSVQERSFLQMVREAGSAGIQKQLVKPESLQGLELRYQQALRQLAQVLKEEREAK